LRPARQIPTHRQKRKPEEISHDVSDYWEYFLVQEDFLSRGDTVLKAALFGRHLGRPAEMKR
jgi:hypothetical protein